MWITLKKFTGKFTPLSSSSPQAKVPIVNILNLAAVRRRRMNSELGGETTGSWKGLRLCTCLVVLRLRDFLERPLTWT
jgi:hypothetical protein